jgi:hypothetical protein
MKETHSLRGFARLVSEMRTAQRECERHGSDSALDHTEALEAKVDAALREILSPTLFGAEDDT